jgi:hypothetical protein
MHSSLEQILISARRLPQDLRVIFEACIMQDTPKDVVCAKHNITPEEFEERQVRLSREMRAIAGPAGTGAQT